MTILRVPAEPTHEVGSTRFTSLVTPSRGAGETSVWYVELPPGTPATPHSLTREEVFVVLDGAAMVMVDGEGGEALEGDAIVVPPGATLALSNPGTMPVRLLCCLPVGGQAYTPERPPFTPPWAL
jgi:quercetin dioxygenase-like cupin family protein